MGVITASRAAMRVDNTDQADQSRSSALAQITMYIPSDVVATYVALQGIFAPGTNHLKWTLFGIGVGLCILLPILNYFTAKNIGGGAGAANAVGGAAGAAGAGAGAAGGGSGRAGGQVTKQAIVIALAVVAFTTYAMALPSSVFVSLFSTAELWGAAAALVLALIMPAVAGAFGITSS
jgi:hypothetical protein